MSKPTKASHAPNSDTQAAQAEGSQQAAQPAPAGAAGAADGADSAVASAEAAAGAQAQVEATDTGVQNPKRGGFYRQEGGEPPVLVHRTLHPDEPEAHEATRKVA